MSGMWTSLVDVEQVLDHHHRVLALLQRLAVEEVGEAGQGLGVVVDGRPDVLLGGRELVGDLLVEGVGETLLSQFGLLVDGTVAST